MQLFDWTLVSPPFCPFSRFSFELRSRPGAGREEEEEEAPRRAGGQTVNARIKVHKIAEKVLNKLI